MIDTNQTLAGVADSELAAIVRSLDDAVISESVDGIVTTWNHGATLVYGYPPAAMVGRSSITLVPSDARAEEHDRRERITAGAAETGFRSTRVCADGQLVEVVVSMSPIRDDDGTVIGVASISRRVSTSERDDTRFASLLEAAPDAIVCVDARGTIVTVNAQVIEMFGYEREELLGAELEILLPEELKHRHVGLRSDYLVDPHVRSMGAGVSLLGRRRNGSVFPIEVSLAPDTTGDETVVIAAVRDMTEQRALEREARENEHHLRQLAENVDIVFLVRQINPPRVLYVSPNAHAVLGHEPSEWMDGRHALTVHPLDRDRVEHEYTAAVAAGQAARAEFRLIMPDGAIQWVRAVSTPVAIPNGQPERSVVTIDDITERVAADEALRVAEQVAREANDAKNQFLSRMSHELRTPLNAVLGFGQLLEMRLTETADADAIQQILRGGRHLMDLIDDVLDISRIEAGETSTSIEVVSVDALINEALQLMAPLAGSAGVTLQAAPSATKYMVLADPQRLRQILLNLLSNAVKYNRAHGTVWVDCQVVDDQVSITVHDDGPGIPAEMQSRLFMPFDRLGAESSGVEGVGLGLALTRSLAALMAGTVSVESELGRGSAFSTTLQLADSPSTGLGSASQESNSQVLAT